MILGCCLFPTLLRKERKLSQNSSNHGGEQSANIEVAVTMSNCLHARKSVGLKKSSNHRRKTQPAASTLDGPSMMDSKRRLS